MELPGAGHLLEVQVRQLSSPKPELEKMFVKSVIIFISLVSGVAALQFVANLSLKNGVSTFIKGGFLLIL